MAKAKSYSPQLSREIVCRLYHRAKAEGVPMTVLTNRIIEEALSRKEQSNRPKAAKNQHIKEPT